MKSVIITGANSGLGYECAKKIARSNQQWHIIMACRNTVSGNIAKEKIVSETKNTNITVLKLDLASLDSVKKFVNEFETKDFPPLHGLINNAGIQVMNGLEFTKDKFELMFGTNHLGHFLLTNLLLERIQQPARIVVVTSGTHDPDSIDGKYNKPVFLGAKKLAKPTDVKEMKGLQRYATSKLANLLFSYELAKKMSQEDIAVIAYDPAGVPTTNLLRSVKSPFVRWVIRASTGIFKLMGTTISTPEKSGGAMADLLLEERFNKKSGKYFQIDTEKKSSKDSYNPQLASELWNDSLELVGLK